MGGEKGMERVGYIKGERERDGGRVGWRKRNREGKREPWIKGGRNGEGWREGSSER